ncbi:hypothetical protein ABIA39_009042 [Nocardia sp. GAS34]|uniref:hypothetical protein n=1 Tax=unclassified Nocardia TaxID=2637762 RepID=UPI003D20B78A
MMPERGGDVGMAGEAEQAHDRVAEGGHDVAGGIGAGLVAVFVEGGVPNEMDPIFNSPVLTQPLSYLMVAGIAHRQTRISYVESDRGAATNSSTATTTN